MKFLGKICCWYCLFGSIVMLIDGKFKDSLFYLIVFISFVLLLNKKKIQKHNKTSINDTSSYNKNIDINKCKMEETNTTDKDLDNAFNNKSVKIIKDVSVLRQTNNNKKVKQKEIDNNKSHDDVQFIIYDNYKLPPLNLIENSPDFIDGICSHKNLLDVTIGKLENEEFLTENITKFPHLIIGGTVMSGKSSLIHNIICNFLMTTRPDQMKFMLIDPKKVELSNYNGVPHLLCPVVTDPKKASLALQKVVVEMERRYYVFAEKGVKNIGRYNDWVDEQNKSNPSNPIPKMFYMLIVIDELADLMLVASKEVEDSIMRISQMARTTGIHLVITLSNASSKEISTLIKSYFPTRISFKTTSKVDSRLILDENGAEQLTEVGLCLYKGFNTSKPIKVKTFLIDEKDIDKITKYVCEEQQAKYDESLTNLNESHITRKNSEPEEYDDPLYNEIVEFAAQTGKISASLIQRRFRLGYNRAAKLIDLLEERGIIGPQNGSKPREVLIMLQDAK